MSHIADVVHVHDTHAVEAERMEKVVVNIPPGEGAKSLWVLGELVTYKIPSRRTGGAYSLFEVTTPPGAGPPAHVNHREDESFYVLEGEYEFSSGGETLRAGAGALLYVPKGTLHAHENVGGGAGRMLLTQTPGGLYEAFFEEIGTPVDDDDGPLVMEDRPDLERITAIGAQYGIEMPPPIARRSRV